MKELERENAYYEAHKAELREKYLHKWLVITGDSLWGVYDKVSEAGKEALKHFEPGEFMIHRPADDDQIIELGPIISTSNPKYDDTTETKGTITAAKGDKMAFQYAH